MFDWLLKQMGLGKKETEEEYYQRVYGRSKAEVEESNRRAGLLDRPDNRTNFLSADGQRVAGSYGDQSNLRPNEKGIVLYGNTTPNTTPNTTQTTTPTQQVNGAKDGGIDEVALAELARRNRINSYKAQAGNLVSQGQSVFDNILKAVNAFRDRSKTQYANAGQEIINRASEILGENARMGRETEAGARARGRAVGLGDSSKFNLQNKIAGNLAATQGRTIARRGEEERANQALLDERDDQAQAQEDEANTYLKGVRERATALENAGYDTAEESFGKSLNDIVNYQRQLASINPLNAGGLTQYNPNFSGIVNTVNGILSGVGGQQATEGDMGNPVNPTNVFELLRRRGLVTG